ncbi:hypothetical protein A5760_18245 [Mycobacterium colombiense]|uniref:Uncharacterized protein n=1 Tax=Mycobacterium colombiense TaxID=339268 RepID=A0A1A0VC63_9MYCO|nr:hypothetical protein A5760_18245 [Mycobacterium colombiense]
MAPCCQSARPICYHQERTLEEAAHKFTKDSGEYRAVKAIFSELYDDYFGYRYLARLRNVLIHDTMMAISLEVEATPIGETRCREARKIDICAFLVKQGRGLTKVSSLSTKLGVQARSSMSIGSWSCSRRFAAPKLVRMTVNPVFW